MISYYDPNVQSWHVIRVTFMVCDYVGHIAHAMGGNCCGADLIDPDFLDTEDQNGIEKYKENDCSFRFDDESEMFTAVLKNAQNDEDEMEKLTAEQCSEYLKCYHPCGDDGLRIRCDRLIEAISQLKEYKDAEKQGRLVVLPCKVGADIYALICGEIKVCVCVGWKWNSGNIYMLCMDRESGQERSFFDFHFTGKIGGLKTVFLTRQEAEKALGAQKED